jgi:pimeloyl-ACP methyl ester carboxylesterase
MVRSFGGSARGSTADRWSGPIPCMSIILHKGDMRSDLSDGAPAPLLPYVCCVGSLMSLFYLDGDLAGTPGSFSPSVRRMCCSQVGQGVLRQNAAVRRYMSRVIRTMRAQQSALFSRRAPNVLARLQLPALFIHGQPSPKLPLPQCGVNSTLFLRGQLNQQPRHIVTGRGFHQGKAHICKFAGLR